MDRHGNKESMDCHDNRESTRRVPVEPEIINVYDVFEI